LANVEGCLQTERKAGEVPLPDPPQRPDERRHCVCRSHLLDVSMGKRKRATKPPPKKKTAKLEKIFDCPFCGHEQTVDCVIERDISVGKVECRVCGVKFSSMIHKLEEEIDVYGKWIDALEEANQDSTAGQVDS